MSYSFQTLNNNTDPTFNQLLGVNNAGTIAGYFGIGQTPAAPNANPNKGYTLAPPYTQASYTNENFPNSAQTQVVGINSFGLTVGFWVDNNTAFDNFGFVDNGGTFTSVVDPNTPTVAGAVNQLLGVNDLKEAAGFYTDASGNNQGYIYNIPTGTFTAVTIPGSSSVTATGINNTLCAALPVLHSCQSSSVTTTGINNAGVISGFYLNGTVTDGFIDNNGSITTLTGPSGATTTQAFGLNNEGQVVGDYVDAAGNTHGFVYSIATAAYTTINDPNATPASPGAPTMTVVNGINDLGQLVGFYLDASGNTDGMLAAIPGTIATIANPTAGSTILMPAGYGGVILQGTNDVTLTDSGTGNALLQGNQGNDTITATGTSDTVIGGNGDNQIAVAGGSNKVVTGTGVNDVSLGSGQNLVDSNGNDRIVSAGGADTVFATSNVFFEGAQGGHLTFIGGNGSDTILGGGGASTIFGGSGNGNLVFAGSGSTEYIGGAGTGTFIGGSGPATVFGGTGGGLIFAGSGGGLFVGQPNTNTEIVAGGGPSTIVGSAGNTVFLSGAANDVAFAGAGNVSLIGGASSGNDVFVAGSGNDQIGSGSGQNAIFAGTGAATIAGGSGSTFYGFVDGQAGGTDVIGNFKLGTDLVGLTGYGSTEISTALSTATVTNGSTSISLTDGTHITFLGVAHLTSSAFVSA